MNLKELDLTRIRKDIDGIDSQIRELIMKRMDQSFLVAQSKVATGETTVFRPEREAEIAKRLSEGVPEDRLAGYLSVVRHIIEISRMYQYDVMFEMLVAMGANSAIKGLDPEIFSKYTVNGHLRPIEISIRFTTPDVPNSLASILRVIGDYGCNINILKVLSRGYVNCETDEQEGRAMATFEAAFSVETEMPELKLQKMLYQLSKETENFEILKVVEI